MNGQSQFKQLAAALEGEHETLDRLFDEARWLPVSHLFVALDALVEQHVTAEEPAVRDLVTDGLCPASTALHIERTHNLMKRLTDEARAAMRDRDDDHFRRALGHLVRVTTARECEEALSGLIRTHPEPPPEIEVPP